MSSERSRFQVFIEGEIGCRDPVHIKQYREVLKELKLNSRHCNEAQGLIDDDCLDIYYKSCLSLAEALESISLGAQSWAIIKLYYSVYYSLKAELGLSGFGLVKCAGIYSIDVRRRLEPKKWSGRGDHITTTNVFKGLRGGQDLLLTNRINEVAVYDWLRDKRERVQYRDRTFLEPDLSYFSEHFRDAQKFRERIGLYLDDTDAVLSLIHISEPTRPY